MLGGGAAYDYDRTRLRSHVRRLGITGYEAEKRLRERYRIEVELSDMYNILCLITPGDTPDTVRRLVEALADIAREQAGAAEGRIFPVVNPTIPTLSLSPRDAFYADTEAVPFEESEGRIIAEFIMVYPPGIPILLPGEVISRENIEYITEQIQIGLPVQGPEDKTLKTVKVIVEERPIFA